MSTKDWDAELKKVDRMMEGASDEALLPAKTAKTPQARAEMDTIAARLREQYPRTNASLGVTTDPLVERVIGATTERSLWLLFGSVGFVLLIACANVANLILSRSASRRTEISLRAALGAGTGRIIRQSLTENLLLSFFAGAISFVPCSTL